MFKHRLMLSAASVALMAGTAWAAGPTDITTILTAPIKTSVDGNTTIKSGGGVSISAIGPAVTIDSSNFVSLENGGKITNKDKDGAQGIVIDATGGDLTIAPGTGVGATDQILNIAGALDLTGTGITKKAILLTGGHIITGDIFMQPSATIDIKGDGSNALQLVKGTTLIGDITTDGKITLNQSTASSTSDSGLTAISILGNMTGNYVNNATISVIGQNSIGVLVGLTDVTTTDFDGSVVNRGTIGTGGTTNRSSSQTNPEGGSALIINRSITGGVYNSGPVTLSDGTVVGTFTTAGASPAVVIAPTLANITLGAVPVGFNPGTDSAGFGFINRGNISAVPVDNNVPSPIIAMRVGGNSVFSTTIAGGIFNSGSIQAQSVSADNANTPLGPVSAYGLVLDQGTNALKLVNTGISSGGSSGVIQAAVAGPADHSFANAIVITAGPVLNPTVMPEILNLTGGQILATATTTETANTSLTAIAIEDLSGQLSHIRNEGKIVATATALDGGTQKAIAIDAAVLRTVGLHIENGFDGGPGAQFGGTITGDINLGDLDDEIDVIGFDATNNASTITGNIAFGNATLLDKLDIGKFSTVTGAITSQTGKLDVAVHDGGILTVLNNQLATPVGLKVHNLDVDGTSALNLTISQPLVAGTVIANGEITLAHGATLGTTIGSFISNTGNFVLLDAPTNMLTIPDANLYIAAFDVPFLFTGSMCTNNVDALHGGNDLDGVGTDCAGNPTGSADSQLILTLNQKTAAQLDLKGYASLPIADVDPSNITPPLPGTLYDLVNQVLPFDDDLGAAVIQGVNSNADAQRVYDAFAPFVSGGSRAIAISITDQATGPIGARQRVLREYGKQPGDSTLWAIEFAQFLKDPGQTLLAGGTKYPAGGTLPGFKDHGFGFSIGGDGGSARDGWYGGALTFYTGDIGEIGDRNGQTQSEWYQLSGYSDWRGRGLFLDTNIDVGVTQYKGKRNIVIDTSPSTTFFRTALNKHTGIYLAGGLTSGAILKYGATTITPKLAVDGLTMRENGYTETGGGPAGGDGFDLAVGSSYNNSLRAFVGADFRQDVNVGSFFLQPEARIGYRYDFLNDPQKVTANFVTLPDNPFTITGPDPSQGNIVAGASVAASTDTWSLGVSFDWVRGSNGATQQSGQFHLIGRI